MLFSRPIAVHGNTALATMITSQLRAADRSARLLDSEQIRQLAPRTLRRFRTLILAEPEDVRTPLTTFIGACAATRHARPPRLLLLHRPGWNGEIPPLPDDPRWHLETVDLAQRGAQALLARWPLHLGMDPAGNQTQVHLLLAGTAPPADAFLSQALRMACYGPARSVVTLPSTDPEQTRAAIHARYPQIGQLAQLRILPPEDLRLAETPAVTLALVCHSDPEEGLTQARGLITAIAREQGASPPLLLEIGDHEPGGELRDWDGQLVPVSAIRLACRPELLLDGRDDSVARTIHEHYRDSIAAQGRDPSREPAGQPWERLAASYKLANRFQADHIQAKLALVDCQAEPEELVESFAFTPSEVERLARIEHQRWAADRYLDGWTHAPVRDNARKHHPQLIDYKELSDPMKDLDRFAVRGVPTLLARSGLGVSRMLIIGIAPADEELHPFRLRGQIRQLLDQLAERYPDRVLVFASTLSDAPARALVQAALERPRTVLFLLLEQPLARTLAQVPETARTALLALLTRAERRIPLGSRTALEDWFARRARILVLPGTGTVPEVPVRHVHIDAHHADLRWNFSY